MELCSHVSTPTTCAETIKGELDSKAMHREVEQFEETHVLREESEVYGFKSAVFSNESF